MKQTLQLMGEDYEQLTLWLQEYQDFNALIIASTKGKMQRHLSFFIQILPISDALQSTFSILEFEDDVKKMMYKKCSYPLLIFILCFFTIYMFSGYVVPQLLSSFQEIETPIFLHVLTFIRISATILLISMLTILFAVVLCCKVPMIKQRVFRKNAMHITLIKEIISYYLSGYMKLLEEKGISTKIALRFITQMEESLYVVRCASLLQSQLLQGKDMLSILQTCPYLCDTCKSAFIMGIHNNQLEKSLSAYIDMQKDVWFTMIQRITISIQCISYTYVGILVICVYQIMLLPLQMINEM